MVELTPLLTVIAVLVIALLLLALFAFIVVGRAIIRGHRYREQRMREIDAAALRRTYIPRTPPGRPMAPPTPSPDPVSRPARPTR